jgi:hypothetical protein
VADSVAPGRALGARDSEENQMKAGWRTAVVLAAVFLFAGAATAAAEDVEGRPSLNPYSLDAEFGPVQIVRYTPACMTVGSSLQVSPFLCWTHFGYSGHLKPKGFGAGLRFDFAAGNATDVFVEARATRGLEDEILGGYRDTDVVFDAITGVIGLSFLLPGSELTTETGEAEALFYHQFEIGIGHQSFEADEDVFDINGLKFESRETDESGILALLRYRVGAQIGQSWYLSFTGGVEVVQRDQFIEPGETEPHDRWDVDVTVSIMLGLDL